VPILIYPAVLSRIHPLSLSQDISKSYSSPTLIKISLVVLPNTSGTGFLVYFHCRIYSSVVGWFHASDVGPPQAALLSNSDGLIDPFSLYVVIGL
jgi:hypothetical protein